MTQRSLALLTFSLLVCASAHAAAKDKHPHVQAKETATQATAQEDIDVDAMARAKDGKPTEPPPAAAEANAGTEATARAEAPAPVEPATATPAEVVSEGAHAEAAESPSTAPNTQVGAPATAMDRPSPLAPPSAATSIEKSIAAGCESRAKSLLDAAQKADYTGATRDFDAKMRTALPPPKFKQAWESLARFGALQGRGQAHPMKGEGYIAISIPLIFDKANLYAQVACGSDGRIAGFYIKPL